MITPTPFARSSGSNGCKTIAASAQTAIKDITAFIAKRLLADATYSFQRNTPHRTTTHTITGHNHSCRTNVRLSITCL